MMVFQKCIAFILSFYEIFYIVESEESDGWETVQRSNKGKSKTSPSQRSLENLHTAAHPQHKLTRSISDPNASIEKYRKKVNSKGRGKLPARKSLANESRTRPRANSKDSEKENRPSSEILKPDVTVTSEIVASANGPIDNVSATETVERVTTPDQSKSKTIDRPTKSASVRKSVVKPTNLDKAQNKPSDKTVINTAGAKPKVEEKPQIKTKGPNTGVRQNAWAKPLKVVEKEPSAAEVKTVENYKTNAGKESDQKTVTVKEKETISDEAESAADEKSDPVEDELEDAINDVSTCSKGKM